MQMFGRRVIYTDEAVITRENVRSVLSKALSVHMANRIEIQYLYDYYRGKTPILAKEKEVRENINHKINVNRAHEIVTFKLGYCFGEPIQYIRRGDDDSLTKDINELNEFMFSEDKAAADKEIAEWMFICGTSYRMVLPGQEDPFQFFTLDPRDSFVVRYNGLGNPVVMGVKYITKQNGEKVYSIYTDNRYFEIAGSRIVKELPNALGQVPIIEYPASNARLGAFEIVLSLLDAISEVESNRLDDLEQFVNAFVAIMGASMSDEIVEKLNVWKMLCLPEGADVKMLASSLNQADTQVYGESLYQTVLTICGIPNRNGGSSTSDTGQAVIMRDGWESAEAHAKSTELMFKKSEKQFLSRVLKILADTVGTKLQLRDIEIKFSRRNYEAILTKSQVLTTMLANPKIHPELAFTHCGMFLDPESAYLMSMKWFEETQKMEEQRLQKEKELAAASQPTEQTGEGDDADAA